MKKFAPVVVALLAFLLVAAFPAVAQKFTLSVARSLLIADSPLHEGDIISISRKGYVRTRLAYDPTMIGVIVSRPAITLTVKEATAEAARKQRVVDSGEVLVRVTTANGPIRGGDPVTSSPLPGVGMKAIKSGYAIGTALAAYSEKDPKKIGLIRVAAQIRYYAASGGGGAVSSALGDIFNLSLLASYEQPLVVFKYLIAAIVLLTSLFIGFFYFGRIAKSGIDSLGRNPLAGRMIQAGIFFNVFLALIVIGVGVALAFVIIRL
jgi:hypothetical protein